MPYFFPFPFVCLCARVCYPCVCVHGCMCVAMNVWGIVQMGVCGGLRLMLGINFNQITSMASLISQLAMEMTLLWNNLFVHCENMSF